MGCTCVTGVCGRLSVGLIKSEFVGGVLGSFSALGAVSNPKGSWEHITRGHQSQVTQSPFAQTLS